MHPKYPNKFSEIRISVDEISTFLNLLSEFREFSIKLETLESSSRLKYSIEESTKYWCPKHSETTFLGPIEWSYQVVLLSGPKRWSYQVVLLSGPIEWSYQVVLLGGPIRRSYQVVLLGGPIEWSYQVVLLGGPIEWSY